jgi:predicted RNA-binding protein YlqC (UPF0109 family)
MEDTQRIAEALMVMMRLVVDQPEKLSLEVVPDGPGWTFRVSVPPSDIGMLIGKQGRIARAFRTILVSVSMKTKQRISLDIV